MTDFENTAVDSGSVESSGSATDVAPQQTESKDFSKELSFQDLMSKQTQEEKNIQDFIELDKLQKFKWRGKEVSVKDLETWEKGHMLQSDYTRKTKELAEQRKFIDNINYDLDQVRNNPALADSFRKVYPESYHKFLDYILPKEQPKTADFGKPQDLNNAQTIQDPRLQKILENWDRVDSYISTQEQKAAAMEINSIFDKMASKYPSANENAIISQVQSMIAQGKQPTEADYEALFKEDHDRIEDLIKRRQSEAISAQKQANKRGKDVGAGGGTPGMAPVKPKTFEEAAELFASDPFFKNF